VVIDYIRAFTDRTMPLGSNLDAQLAVTVTVLEAARNAQIPIYYTIVAYDEEGMGDAGVWLQKQRGIVTLRAGTPAVELDPRLGRRPDEAVIVKKYASSFFGTDLVSRLNSHQVDTLLITGATTSGCVRATAVDAVQYGYRPMVLEDAVGDRSASAHRQALFDLDQKYADVIASDTAITYLAGLTPPTNRQTPPSPRKAVLK
jgi:maleamate amidohydrolase